MPEEKCQFLQKNPSEICLLTNELCEFAEDNKVLENPHELCYIHRVLGLPEKSRMRSHAET